MFRRLLVLLSLVTSVAFADPNQILPDGRIAYYGEALPQPAHTTFKFFPQYGDLKKDLFTIMNSSHLSTKGRADKIGSCQDEGSCYRHQQVGYSRARTIMFGELYVERDQNGMFVEEVYCERKIYFRNVNEIPGLNSKVNIEHTWPQSKFTRSFNKEMQKSDLHHLFPTDSKANSIRGNHEFGESRGLMNNDLCEASRIEHTSDGMIFTPPTKHRGNVARAMFYFSIRYQMPISPEQEAALREWHQEDPVDALEVERHNLIAKHQNVRNPFVDFPEFVNEIKDF